MLTWSKIHLNSKKDVEQYFENKTIKYIAIDTETTGLHIILDKPFFMTMAILTNNNEAFAYSIPINEQSIPIIKSKIISKLKEATKILFFNAKYDLHMLYNVGIDILKDYKNKVSDVAIYTRAGLDAISPREGGDVLKLKLLAEKYIDKRASIGEGVIIYPNSYILGETIIGNNTIIYPNTTIENSVIGSNCEIKSK